MVSRLRQIDLDQCQSLDLSYLITLYSNLMQDELELDEKEKILAMLLATYRSDSIRKEMQRPSPKNVRLWQTISYNVVSLVPGLTWMGEEEAGEVESLCWEEIVRMLEVLTQKPGPWSEVPVDFQEKIMQNVCEALRGLILVQ